MTLKERFDKLEPRERRLLTFLLGMLGAALFLGFPIWLYSSVTDKRSEIQEIRDLIQSIREAETKLSDRKARQDALLARYAKPTPPLAGFIESAAKQQGLTAAESQDRPDIPHGKRYNERVTVIKMHKIGMLPLAKTLEHIEQSGHPVTITKLNIKPRSGEPDSYEVELGVSAFDRKPDPNAPTQTASTAEPAEKEERGDDEEAEP